MKRQCPMCGKIIEYNSDNPFRPFCSKRCKTTDLGAWADEKYSVPGKKVDIENEIPQNPDLPDDDPSILH